MNNACVTAWRQYVIILRSRRSSRVSAWVRWPGRSCGSSISASVGCALNRPITDSRPGSRSTPDAHLADPHTVSQPRSPGAPSVPEETQEAKKWKEDKSCQTLCDRGWEQEVILVERSNELGSYGNEYAGKYKPSKRVALVCILKQRSVVVSPLMHICSGNLSANSRYFPCAFCPFRLFT